MTKRDAIKWIKRRVAQEIRLRIGDSTPEYVLEAPDPDKVTALWQDTVWHIADRVSPETHE